MNLLDKLRIGPRLALAFGLVVLLMSVIVSIGVGGLRTVAAELDLLINDRVLKVKLVNEVIDLLNLQARDARNLLLVDDADQRNEAQKEIDQAGEDIGKAYAKLEPMLTSAGGKSMFAQLMKARTDFRGTLQVFTRQVKAGDVEGAKGILFDRLRPQQLEYMKQLYALAAYQEKLMDEASGSTQQGVKRATVLMLGAAALALAIAVFAGVAVSRSVTRPVAVLVTNLQSVAEGDLTVEVASNRSDEIGLLQRALADTVASLRTVVGQVRSGVDSVTTAASQIAAGNQDLSQRTEEQASSLQQTASSMEQLNSTVRQSADNALQANQLAAAASGAAERGGEVVGGVVSTMEGISGSSRRIADIIGVIDGIAFQTNILALNAAVEAARAGEQGRGFAVVAGEVRLLAQRSAEAAKEIKNLISRSVEQVEIGTRQVADAGSAMQEIVGQVRKVTDLIGEIASAAQEQSSGIGQVNQAVSQMDQVTQQNAALVEESAAAAGSLAQQAQRLAEAVAVFRVAAGSAAAPAPKTVAKAAPAKLAPAAARKTPAAVARAPAKPVTTAPRTAPSPPRSNATVQVQPESDEWTSF